MRACARQPQGTLVQKSQVFTPDQDKVFDNMKTENKDEAGSELKGGVCILGFEDGVGLRANFMLHVVKLCTL